MTWPAALLDPEITPPGITNPKGAPAGRRFDVYRNNVLSSLVQAMRDGFPVIQRLVGEDFFAALASAFVRAHPPASPMLFTYGTDFPDFLERFPPVETLPYLADVARLELALRRAYHAADTTPIDPQRLSHPQIDAARVTLAPSVSVLTSPYPIYGIWRANSGPNAPAPGQGPEAVLVTRPDWDAVAEPISPQEAQFLAALPSHAIGAAAQILGAEALPAALARLIARKAITDLKVPR